MVVFVVGVNQARDRGDGRPLARGSGPEIRTRPAALREGLRESRDGGVRVE
jgi:hypothetical protein